jgi:DNA-binding cell septation regulator SpoVG
MGNRITEIQITPIKPNDGLVGFASLVFDNCFYFGSIGIYTRPQGGFRLTYPTRKGANGNFHIFHPINREAAEAIEEAVISKFEEATKSYDRHNSFTTR